MMNSMKTSVRTLGFVTALLIAILAGTAVHASEQVVLGGARYHQSHTAFADLPFGEGDISYCAAYEFQDQDALWQLGVNITPELGDRKDIEYAVTPQLNLLLRDRIFRGGLGILSTYTRDSDGKGDWMDMYWQFILGIEIPLPGPFVVSGNAYYVFDKWDALGDFDFENVEYGVSAGFRF